MLPPSLRYDSHSGGEREIQRTMLELLNQLDGFDSRGDVKVCAYNVRVCVHVHACECVHTYVCTMCMCGCVYVRTLVYGCVSLWSVISSVVYTCRLSWPPIALKLLTQPSFGQVS